MVLTLQLLYQLYEFSWIFPVQKYTFFSIIPTLHRWTVSLCFPITLCWFVCFLHTLMHCCVSGLFLGSVFLSCFTCLFCLCYTAFYLQIISFFFFLLYACPWACCFWVHFCKTLARWLFFYWEVNIQEQQKVTHITLLSWYIWPSVHIKHCSCAATLI